MTTFIGLFDSGLGGLTVFKAVSQLNKKYDLVYLGDSARAPYGNRSQEAIYKFTVEGLEFLFSKGVDLVVLACNSASNSALRRIQTEFLPRYYSNKKVLGVVIPASEVAVETTRNGKIGVIGTTSTIESAAYEREIGKLDNSIQVFKSACPLFVPVIESRVESNQDLLKVLFEMYLTDLKKTEIDTLILGCTHYEIISKQIQDYFGDTVKIISQGEITAKKLETYLHNHPEIESKLGYNGKYSLYTTDLSTNFKEYCYGYLADTATVVSVNLD